MKPVVLDASAGIEMVLGKHHPARIRQELEDAPRVLSSSLYPAEVTNVLRKYHVGGVINGAMAGQLLGLVLGVVDEYHDTLDFTAEALRESIRSGHSAYDMFYFTLARRFDARLISMDRRLNRLAGDAGIDIVDL